MSNPDVALDRKYEQLIQAGFQLGPRRSPVPDPDGEGFVSHYEPGTSIAFHPSIGAHAVHGPIRRKWMALGAERGALGYPLTDETRTLDRRGRYNHFQGGSIFWTRETGAHAVYGPIRQKWAESNWERGPLGYPTGDEQVTPDGEGRFNTFEHGRIV